MNDATLYLSSASAAGAAFAATYAPLSHYLRTRSSRDGSLNTTDSDESTQQNTLSTERARELLDQLHEVTTGVAGDVKEHSAVMTTVNQELNDAKDSDDAEQTVVRIIKEIVRANVRLQKQLDERSRVIERQSRQIQLQLADPLTGIPNRGAFDNELKRRTAEWRRVQTQFSLILLDVDHFKNFNDDYGHQAGDTVLKGVAKAYAGTLGEMDLAARYGGEEFSAILPGINLEQATLAAERVRKSIEQAAHSFEGQSLQVTASVGVTQVTTGDDLESIVKRADQALYAAKNSGRNRTYFHDGQGCHPAVGTSEPKVMADSVSATTTPRDGHRTDAPVVKKTNLGEDIRSTPQETVTPIAPTESPSIDAPSAGATTPKIPDPASAKQRSETGSCPTNLEHVVSLTSPSADILTGLPNRQAFVDDVQRRMAEFRRDDRTLALVIMSIDNFIDLNTRHGKSATDLVLTTMRQFLSAALREMDSICRFGEREFGVLLPTCNLSGAISVAERVRTAIAKCDLLRFAGTMVRFTVSVGVVEAVEDDANEAIVTRLETALAAAQENGGNVTFVHDGKQCIKAEPPKTAPFIGDSELSEIEISP